MRFNLRSYVWFQNRTSALLHFYFQWKWKEKFCEQKLQNSTHNDILCLSFWVPRKLRPQTMKTQTLWVSRKLRPKLRLWENSKTQTLIDNTNFTQRVPRITANRLVSRKLRLQTLKYRIASWICRKNKTARGGKYLHWSRAKIIFNVSPNPLKFNCVTVSQPAHVCPASDSGYS